MTRLTSAQDWRGSTEARKRPKFAEFTNNEGGSEDGKPR